MHAGLPTELGCTVHPRPSASLCAHTPAVAMSDFKAKFKAALSQRTSIPVGCRAAAWMAHMHHAYAVPDPSSRPVCVCAPVQTKEQLRELKARKAQVGIE